MKPATACVRFRWKKFPNLLNRNIIIALSSSCQSEHITVVLPRPPSVAERRQIRAATLFMRQTQELAGSLGQKWL
jgi:hypothetical protein